MSRRTRAFAALGIAAYLLFLAALLPARFVVTRMALPPGIELQAVEGTPWSGQARVAWQAGAAAGVIDSVRWSFRPLALLSGRAAYDIVARSAGLQGRGRLARGLSAWTLRDLDLQGDAGALAAFVPLASAWQPAGRIRASATMLAWDGRELRGRADLQWSDAAIALSNVRPLGSYALHIEGDGGPARVKLATTQGVLRLSGEGTLDGLGHFALTGEARAEGPQARDLTPLLDLLGPRRADGSRALRIAA